MAFIPVPNAVQLCFDFLTAGQKWQFCVVVRKPTGSINQTDRDNIAVIAEDLWDGIKDKLSDDVTLVQNRITDITQQGGTESLYAVGTTGGVSNQAGALNAPVVVSHRTPKRGRSYRGRSYISGLPETLMGTVTFDSGVASDWLTAWSTFRDDLITGGFRHCIATKQHNGAVVTPAEVNDVTSYIIDLNLDSQRRRLAGRGT